MNKFKVGSHLIDNKNSCIIVAEIGPNHNGNFKRAIELIDLAKKSGCEAVKFQYRLADEELTDKKSKSYFFNKARYDFIKRVQEFSFKEHQKLRLYCKKRKLLYICSVFSEKSLDLLLKLKPDAIKVPSGELNNLWLLNKLLIVKEPIIISSGMSNEYEIQKILYLFRNKRNKVFLHCTSEYPTKIKDVNLNFIKKIQNEYKVFAGLSDHSKNLDVLGAAIAIGAKIIEVHFTKNSKMKGPDHKVSLTPSKMRKLILMRNNIINALGIKNKILGPHVNQMRRTFSNSIYSRVDIKKGDKLTKEKICFMKPGTGLSPFDYKKVINKITKRGIKKNKLILLKDVK